MTSRVLWCHECGQFLVDDRCTEECPQPSIDGFDLRSGLPLEDVKLKTESDEFETSESKLVGANSS